MLLTRASKIIDFAIPVYPMAARSAAVREEHATSPRCPHVWLARNLQAEFGAKLLQLGAKIGQLQLIDKRQPFQRRRAHHQANRQQHNQRHQRRRDSCRQMPIPTHFTSVQRYSGCTTTPSSAPRTAAPKNPATPGKK